MKTFLIFSMLCVSCLSLCACRQGDESIADSAEGQENSMEVSVVEVKAERESVELNRPGRLEPFLQAEVRARVTGILQKRLYHEGQSVKAGDALFKIEPDTLQAVYNVRCAEVERAKVILEDARDKLNRYAQLVNKGAISGREHIQAQSDVARATAELTAAEAALEQARLDLNYTNVLSPIDGRVRRALVTEGALVNQAEFTHLTTVEQIDPIYVRFSVPATQYNKVRRAVQSGEWLGISTDQIKVRLDIPGAGEYPHTGSFFFSDKAVDPATDTIEMRAQFPNPDGDLLPGAYVRVVFEQAVRKQVFFIPRDSLIRTEHGASVYVVNKDGVLESRAIIAETLKGKQWRVTDGLKDGDRVVTGKISVLQPGMAVTVKFGDKSAATK